MPVNPVPPRHGKPDLAAGAERVELAFHAATSLRIRLEKRALREVGRVAPEAARERARGDQQLRLGRDAVHPVVFERALPRHHRAALERPPEDRFQLLVALDDHMARLRGDVGHAGAEHDLVAQPLLGQHQQHAALERLVVPFRQREAAVAADEAVEAAPVLVAVPARPRIRRTSGGAGRCCSARSRRRGRG